MAFNWRKFPWTNLHELNLDWIIQTVKTLEENLADAIALMRTTAQNVVDSTISALLTGDGDFTVNKNGNVSIAGNRVQMNGNPVQIEGVGDLTVNKTGDVNLTGNNVRITSGSQAQMIGGAFISDGGQQLTLHNPNSSTNMTANYNSGVLHLTNNQNEAGGVAIYPINTPADGGGDNSDFAANVGYVKDAVAAVDGKLDTEISNRTSGDAALQSTIDNVIMPLINALQKRAPRVFYFSTTAAVSTLTADDVNTIKTALLDHTPVIFIAYNDVEGVQYYYYVVKCVPAPTAENINAGGTINFRTLDSQYSATLTTGSDNSGSVRFGTIS